MADSLEAKVLNALENNPEFKDPKVLEQIKQYASLLLEIIGSERLGSIVTMEATFQIGRELWQRMLSEECSYLSADETSKKIKASKFLQATLAYSGYTDKNFLMHYRMRLSPKLHAKFELGKLTFAHLLTEQPDFFLP